MFILHPDPENFGIGDVFEFGLSITYFSNGWFDRHLVKCSTGDSTTEKDLKGNG